MLSRWGACRYIQSADGWISTLPVCEIQPPELWCKSRSWLHSKMMPQKVVDENYALGYFLISKILYHLGIFRIPIVLLQPAVASSCSDDYSTTLSSLDRLSNCPVGAGAPVKWTQVQALVSGVTWLTTGEPFQGEPPKTIWLHLTIDDLSRHSDESAFLILIKLRPQEVAVFPD